MAAERATLILEILVSRASGDGLEMQLQPKCLGDLHDGREGRVPVGGEWLVEPLAAHANPAGQLVDVAGARDCAERLGNHCWVVAGLVDGGFEVGGYIVDARQVVGTVVVSESLGRLAHRSSIPRRSD